MATTINRRRLIQGAGATLGTLALRGFAIAGEAQAHFTHGVASGDPLADRVMLWTRVLPGSGQHQTLKVVWQVAADAGFADIVATGSTETSAARDYTVKVDAAGLRPGGYYFYRFLVDGLASMTGRTRTLPTGDVRRFRIGVASCSNYPQGYFNAYRDMAESNLDLVLHLGDYIYEYPEGGYANPVALEQLGRHVEPLTEVLSLEDYRMRYGLYRTDADLQLLHQRQAFVCVWDDHELANNTWQNGAQNHNDGEGDFQARMRAARQAYDEWMPIRTHASGNQGPIYRAFQIGNLADLVMLDTRLHGRDKGLEYGNDLPMQQQAFDVSNPDAAIAVDANRLSQLGGAGIQWLDVPFDTSSGKPVAITEYEKIKDLTAETLPSGWRYLPDVDRFRRETLDNPQRTILGADQEQWLQQTLRRGAARGATWQVIGQQVLMGRVGIPQFKDEDFQVEELSQRTARFVDFMQTMAGYGLPFNLDAWDGYPACRERVLRDLKAYAANPVVLAGDTHNSWAFNLSDQHGDSVGVEIGTPGISSPGMEGFLPVAPQTLVAAMKAGSAEVVDLDSEHRGWSEITLTPTEMRSQWHFVSTILDRKYDISSSAPLVCVAGSRKFT